MERIKTFFEAAPPRLWQYAAGMAGGLLAAVEATVPFFVPCMIATVLDIWSAVALAKRVHRKYPDRADGKFRSEYKFRIILMLIVAFLLLILASYVDTLVFGEGGRAVSWAFGFFLFYQAWSVLENWSSENDRAIPRALQRIMVNKAERHFNVPLGDIMLGEKKEGKKDGENSI